MSQDWVANLYTTATTGDTTLSNMELMFATLRSSFSGTSAPSSPVDGNLFYHTTKDLLEVYRNASWVGVMAGSAAFKIWVYLNAAEDGWAIDATVTDCVLALKGGSQAYNRTGGGTAGTWTQPSHTLVTAEMPSHEHRLAGDNNPAAGNAISMGHTITSDSIATINQTGSIIWYSTTVSGCDLMETTGGGGAHNHGTTHRPLGAVGVLKYCDV